MAIVISPRIRKKLEEKHGVSEDEIRQCFANVEGGFIRDTREEHQTDPPSHWFVAETNRRRKLKVVFVARKVLAVDGNETVQIEIKTAYDANGEEISIYERLGQCR
jgi:hypothetical protein